MVKIDNFIVRMPGYDQRGMMSVQRGILFEKQLFCGFFCERPNGLELSEPALTNGMAGAPGGVLSHSFYPLPKGILFDEMPIGEIGMNIYTFSEYDVPCIMVTGDQAAVDEAAKLIPNIVGVPVKWGLGEKEKLGALTVRQAVSLSPAKARAAIKDAAKRALGKVDDFKPLRLKKPFTLRVEFIDAKYAEDKMKMPGVKRADDVTISKVCKSLGDVVF